MDLFRTTQSFPMAQNLLFSSTISKSFLFNFHISFILFCIFQITLMSNVLKGLVTMRSNPSNATYIDLEHYPQRLWWPNATTVMSDISMILESKLPLEY